MYRQRTQRKKTTPALMWGELPESVFLRYHAFCMALFGKLFGDENKRVLAALAPTVASINALESEVSGLSDEALCAKTDEFKKRIAGGVTLDELLPEAFSVVREAARRTLGERHYDVQLVSGIVMHRGGIAEMKTGEGKTLAATLPVYLNALSGRGVHVVTVNDYLSRRDAVWMGQIYASLGLSVGVVNSQASYLYDPEHLTARLAAAPAKRAGKAGSEKEPSRRGGAEADKKRDEVGAFKIMYEFLRSCERKESYEADITYGTNNEFGFDYLRDNTVYEAAAMRQREHHFAIVDEIDSILIDEARTPLIISAPAAESGNLYKTFAAVARELHKDTDFEVDEKFKAVTLTDAGIEKAERILGIENIYTDRGIKYVHHLETAVRAKALFGRDKEYVVRDGDIVIVDEFTGRLQPGRRWSEGLHQAIEAKEGVQVQQESRTVASITFQNYFRMYEKLAGMTGTALTSREEFFKVYGLDTIAIPPNVPSQRNDMGDLIFQTEEGKLSALAQKVKELHKEGRPVLIGTVSIEKNELTSAHLSREGIPHEVLNAKNHEREGEIIAQAGLKGKVTIATNMAGRGVDIKLGGAQATKEDYETVKAHGGLFVVGTERHEARRIDNQLRGRSGRQGDPGTTQFYVSLEDTLMRVFAAETIKGMMGRFGIPEDQPIENKLITRSLESAQTKIEGFHFDARKHVLEYDNVLNHQRQSIYARRKKILTGSMAELDEELTMLIAGDEELTRTMAKKKDALDDEEFYAVLRRLFLQAIDVLWIEHLEVMEYTRDSIRLRAYGQRDPLIEYRKEGLRLFQEMKTSIDEMIVKLLPGMGSGAFAMSQQALKPVHETPLRFAAPGVLQEGQGGGTTKMVQKIGRNELVKITNGNETKEIKFKKAESLLAGGEWKLVRKV